MRVTLTGLHLGPAAGKTFLLSGLRPRLFSWSCEREEFEVKWFGQSAFEGQTLPTSKNTTLVKEDNKHELVAAFPRIFPSPRLLWSSLKRFFARRGHRAVGSAWFKLTFMERIFSLFFSFFFHTG